jgi:uncharacterized caspase-like protein
MNKLARGCLRVAKYVIPLAGLIPLAFAISVGLERLAPEKAQAALNGDATVASPANASGDRVALIIGNADYPDANMPLRHPVRDAHALAEQLRRNGFDVDVRQNLGKDEMKQAFDRFKARIKPGAVAFVSFGGYGIEVGRRSYMIPVDAQIWKETDVRRDGVAIESVLADMHKSGASVKLAVFDASRRNPFERRFRGVSSGLGAIDAPPGTLLMSAAATGKVAYDADGEHSLLMAELLKEINAPGLDAETVFNHTRIGVSRASSGEQVPLVSSSLVESFAFVSGARRHGRPTAALAPKPAVRGESIESAAAHSTDAVAAPEKLVEYELAAKPVDPTPVAPKAVEATAEAKPIEQKPVEQKPAPVAKAKKTKAADDVKRSRRPMHEVTREIEREPSRPIRRNWWQSEFEREHKFRMSMERRQTSMHRRLFGGIGF